MLPRHRVVARTAAPTSAHSDRSSLKQYWYGVSLPKELMTFRELFLIDKVDVSLAWRVAGREEAVP